MTMTMITTKALSAAKAITNDDPKHQQRLEENLRCVERMCQRYKLKANVQDILIKEMLDVIHSLTIDGATGSPADKSDDGDATTNSAKTANLLIDSAKRIAALTSEVEKMKLQLQEQQRQQEKFANQPNFNDCNDSDQSTDSTTTFLDFDKEDDDDDGNKARVEELERERDSYKKKCDTLKRSIDTLKRKNCEREMRTMKSLRNMRQQMDVLETERKRRLEQQQITEVRLQQLEIELDVAQNAIEQKKTHQRLRVVVDRSSDVVDQREDIHQHDEEAEKGETVLRKEPPPRKTFSVTPPFLVPITEEDIDDGDEAEEDN